MGPRVASLRRPEPWGAGSGSRKRRYLGGGLRQVLERVDGAPVGVAAVAKEPALSNELGERRRLVVAAVGQAAQELPRNDVEPGVDPLPQQRLLIEGGDAATAVDASDAIGAAEAGEHDGGGGVLAAVIVQHGCQGLVREDIAVEGDDDVLVRRQKVGAQLGGAAAAQRQFFQRVVGPESEAGADPEVPLDDVRLVSAEEDGVADALAGQPAYLVLEDRR